jgi:hypothetical protein
LHKVNGSHEFSVKLSEEFGGGYMESVEVLHQLHCLNMLRQATYEDYYKDKAEPWKIVHKFSVTTSVSYPTLTKRNLE